MNHKAKFKGIVLSAGGKKVISKEDADIIKKCGLLVIDCSWAKIEEINVSYENERLCNLIYKVPFMVAVNNINYGKPYMLSCAEALAAGLHIAGFY